MRTTWTLALTGVLLAVLVVSAAPASEPAADAQAPVSHWTFDGSLADTAGQTRDNLTARSDKQTETPARFVSAEELPGTDGRAVALGVKPGDAEYLTAAISDDVRLGPSYTVAAWILPTQVGGWNRLVLNWGGAPNYAYHVAIHDGRASLYHGQADGTYLFAEGGRVTADRWYHLAAVARRNDAEPGKSTLSVYLNGRRVGTGTFDGTIKTLDAEPLGIGDSAGGPSGACRFLGYLDELAVWDRALGEDEIAAQFAKRADVLRKLEAEQQKLENARRAKLLARLDTRGLEEIVFAERAPGRDPAGHYYANFGYSCIDPDYWIHGADGGRLVKLSLRSGELTILVDDPGGAVRDPQVHYDGRKVLFSYRKGGTHRYHLYEINTDGSGLRQLSDGPWDDVEPTYLPDGDVMFCSTRCGRWIGCWLAESATLHRCGANGRNIRMVSSGSFTENTPAVLPDGRVLYTRWEYVNRDAVSFHHLWTVNPDGTGQMVYFGNERPGGVFIDGQPIPGTGQVVLIHSPGHGRNEHAGDVAIVAEKSGPSAASAMRNLTRGGDFRDPWPLSADAFLAARGNQVVMLEGDGRAEVLYTGGQMVHEPRPVVRRARERIVAPRADLAEATATVVLADVYRGRNLAGVRRGSIKRLLVLEDLPKPANYHGGGSQPIGHGVTSTLKRILGTVPVEPDGSAAFQVPALRSVYFALLDENDLSVKQMRSFVTLQPGETLGCVGCHEPRTQTPSGIAGRAPAALAREPSRIRPIDGVPQVMDFPRDVQPVLDRHCVRCHNPDKRDGGVVLSGDRGPVFSQSYYELYLHWQVKDTGGPPGHGTGRQPGGDAPSTTYSSASPLVKLLEGSHYDARPSREEQRTIRLWIDSGCAYPGTYAAYGTGQVGGCWGNNEPVRAMADGWATTPPAVEAIERRCGACHKGQLPRHVTDRVPLDPWGDMLSWTRPLSRYSRHRLYNLSRPEKSLVLMAPLAKGAGGYAEGQAAGKPAVVKEDRRRPPEPIVHPVVFADTSDADYRKILAHVEAAGAKLEEIKRFDMPGFRPSPQYIREMRRHGILPAEVSPEAPIDVYATDAAYWRLFWHRPRAAADTQR